MASFKCEQCGGPFVRDRSGARPIRFCGNACYQAFRAATGYNKSGTFKPGLKPWNKDIKGLHLSPGTQFKKGCESLRRVAVGTITVRIDKNGKPRNHIKVAEPNKWQLLAVVVYERERGPLQAGLVVHHRDRDSLNDVPDNLQAMTRAEHMNEHRAELKIHSDTTGAAA